MIVAESVIDDSGFGDRGMMIRHDNRPVLSRDIEQCNAVLDAYDAGDHDLLLEYAKTELRESKRDRLILGMMGKMFDENEMESCVAGVGDERAAVGLSIRFWQKVARGPEDAFQAGV